MLETSQYRLEASIRHPSQDTCYLRPHCHYRRTRLARRSSHEAHWLILSRALAQLLFLPLIPGRFVPGTSTTKVISQLLSAEYRLVRAPSASDGETSCE